MSRHSPLVERISYHLARMRAWARRVTAPGLSVRAVIWLAGAAALTLATPSPLRLAAVAPVAAVLALLPAGFPGTRWVTFVEVAAIAALAADPGSLWTVLLLAALLYLHHTAAALGAQLRTDTVMPAAVLRHWARRAVVVLAGSVILSLAIVAMVQQAPAGAATGYVALGAAAAVVMVGHLAWVAYRQTQ